MKTNKNECSTKTINKLNEKNSILRKIEKNKRAFFFFILILISSSGWIGFSKKNEEFDVREKRR